MANISSLNLEFENNSGLYQKSANPLTTGLSVILGNGSTVYSVASIPATVQKIYINLYSTGYSSGPLNNTIAVKNNVGTNGIMQYFNVLNNGAAYSAYSGSAGTNMWVGTTYYTMSNVSIEIWKVHDTEYLYRMYGNAGAGSTLLTGYGRISNISNISQIDISSGNTYTFANAILNISWE